MASVDLRHKFGPVEHQGSTNACVAHAATSMAEAALGVSDLSRLFVYYNARTYTGTQSRDSGCTPRNAMRAISQFGAPSETYWPYSTTRVTVKPDATAYNMGAPLRSRIKAYQSVTTLDAMKAALVQGLPVMFSHMVPDNFMTTTRYTGVQTPMSTVTRWIGSHAMVACGFDDAKGMVLCRNSFGTSWGQDGYCWMPYDWFANMRYRVTDAWTIVPV